MQPISTAALAALRLSRVRGVGVCMGQQLLEACGSYEAIWQMSEADWQAIEGVGPKLLAALKQSNAQEVEEIKQYCQKQDIALLCPEDAIYPSDLKQIDDAPLTLFVRGHLKPLKHQRMLSVVGARKSSQESRVLTSRWCKFFSQRDISVVSGMAYGIDAAAHRGALQGDTPTIAVLGCGLASLQQRQEEQIAAIIEHGGCVLSEYLPHQEARPEYFPQRNRIIAALGYATLVVEADVRSGSLITAHKALAYGREVLAVPGSVLQAGHAGCHQLIRDGGLLVDSAEQVLESLHWQVNKAAGIKFEGLNTEEKVVLSALEHDILHLDALSDSCGLTVSALSPILLALELRGAIERLPGSRYTLGG